MGQLKVSYDGVPGITPPVSTIISAYETVRQSWLSGLSVLEDSTLAAGGSRPIGKLLLSLSSILFIYFCCSVAVWLGVGN